MALVAPHHGEGVLIGDIVADKDGGSAAEGRFRQEARDDGALVLPARLELDDVVAALDLIAITQVLALGLEQGLGGRCALGCLPRMKCDRAALVLVMGTRVLGHEGRHARAGGIEARIAVDASHDVAVRAAALDAVDTRHR